MRHLSLDRVRDIIVALPAACKGSSKLSHERKRLMILMTFWHGLRASETCAMRGKNIRNG